MEKTVREQLARLDFTSGREFLTRIDETVEGLQHRIAAARGELQSLMALAAAAENTQTLRTINDRLAALGADLFLAAGSVPMVQELCTTVRESIVVRALELARRDLYREGSYCEAPLALLAVGSSGRCEELLSSDQDYLFLHGVGEVISVQMGEAVADYFAHLGAVFVGKLEEAGIARCSGGIMPVNGAWRGTPQEWEKRLEQMLRFERNDWEANILTVIALMDARFLCGDRALGAAFGASARSAVRNTAHAIRHMARVVGSMRLSRGFLKRFIVEADGPHRGEFNLKVTAWMPLIMAVRLLAVNAGIEETSTLARIDRLRTGSLTERMANDLTDAYHVLTGHRILQQSRLLKKIIDDACYLNPHELPGPERERLRDAIGTVEELQGMIRSMFSMAASADRIIDRSR
jgi:signal-transduction protein with cAMP-binding, CBS, and nucleotidyltransferase domain